MNRDQVEGNWKQLIGEIRQEWGKLTDDDIDYMEGSYEKMVGRIQERYGVAREDVERQVGDWRR